LFFALIDFARDGASLRKIMRRVLRYALLDFLRLLVLNSASFDDTYELFRRLAGDSLDVSLEDEEILGLDEKHRSSAF